MELKIKYEGKVGGVPRIKVFGVVEWAEESPPSAMWFAWGLGKRKIEASYHTRDEAPREVDLTVQTGEDTVSQMLDQIEAMLKKRGWMFCEGCMFWWGPEGRK